MKIDFRPIVRDHFATLYVAETRRISVLDIILFFAAPLLVGAVSFFFCFSVKQEFYNVSITFFGIFIALLLNLQVAVFSIYQRKWDSPTDKRLAARQEEVVRVRKKLLGELNSNISYLTFVCVVALIIFILFYVMQWLRGFAPAFAVAVYVHFIFTLLMVVKRAHALFQREYRGDSV